MEGSTKLQKYNLSISKSTIYVESMDDKINIKFDSWILNLFVVTSRISLIRFLLIYVINTDFIIESNLNLIN